MFETAKPYVDQMKTENLIQEKSFLFSVKVIQVCKELKIKREFELARQLLKSGTSIGANVEEAIGASSRKDFINKLSIAYKEARETTYWLRLIRATNDNFDLQTNELLDLSQQIERILVSILKSSKSNS